MSSYANFEDCSGLAAHPAFQTQQAGEVGQHQSGRLMLVKLQGKQLCCCIERVTPANHSQACVTAETPAHRDEQACLRAYKTDVWVLQALSFAQQACFQVVMLFPNREVSFRVRSRWFHFGLGIGRVSVRETGKAAIVRVELSICALKRGSINRSSLPFQCKHS